MAVPKKKTSHSKTRQRKAGKGLKQANISYNSKTGEPHLSHRMSKDGIYNGEKHL